MRRLAPNGDQTKGEGLFKRIVVGTDGSDTATEAVRQAIELAKASGAKLDVVAAFEPVPQSRLREERGEVPGDVQYAVGPREDVNVTLEGAIGMAKQAGVDAEPYPREGDPADAILDVAEETGADLVVVGNKGMTGAKRFLLGSVPNKVSHHAPSSVFIVRTT
jgi:nucleotide-binding universal stress UspA family protein